MRHCSNCGQQLPDDMKFCFQCGTATTAPTATPPAPPTAPDSPAQPLSATITGKKRKRRSYDNEELKKGVTLCDDGKYRWIYPFNMWTNPTILFLVYKIFLCIFAGVGLLILFLSWDHIAWGDWEKMWDDTWPFLAFVGFFCVLIFLAYAIVAGMYGGKYTILFTMDENGINHEQIPEQAKKARKLGMLTAGAGAAGGSLSTIGLGISVASRTSMYSDFKSVRSVKAGRWSNVIKIREILSNNQVYVRKEDFDFVFDYIRAHCPKVQTRHKA